MKSGAGVSFWGLAAAILTVVCLCLPAAAAVRDVQTVSFQQGWNAVFLRVDPGGLSADALFSGTPVDTVAAYFPELTSVQFLADPAEAPWKEPGWGVWYAPHREQSFLTTLHAVFGGRAYLVHATEAFTWRVEGTLKHRELRWRANGFTLTGLPVSRDAAPTFGEFFAGVPAFSDGRFYHLTDGRWKKIEHPDTTAIVPDRAYWIYCRGASVWQGPVEVDLGGRETVIFDGAATTRVLRFRNRGPGASVVHIECLPAGDAAAAASGVLTWTERDPETLQTAYHAFGSGKAIGPLPPGGIAELHLHLRRERLPSAGGLSFILRGTADAGSEIAIPVSIANPESRTP